MSCIAVGSAELQTWSANKIVAKRHRCSTRNEKPEQCGNFVQHFCTRFMSDAGINGIHKMTLYRQFSGLGSAFGPCVCVCVCVCAFVRVISPERK